MAALILSRMGRRLLIILLTSIFTISTIATLDIPQVLLETPSTIDDIDEAAAPQSQPHEAPTLTDSPISESLIAELNADLKPSFPIFHALHDALSTMQDQYFALWLGRWTTAIDWTAAVMNTHLSATLMSFSNIFESGTPSDAPSRMLENTIAKYFAQSSAFYFGEDAFSIRMQAYDDILWVVLEWLESIKFIESHSARHYPSKRNHHGTWHAKQFVVPFEHRARIFYELAEQGWDETLCGGGLTWNPRLLPYKNAITNQLYISASVGMYLYFPGDANCSPVFWGAGSDQDCGQENRVRYDKSFLENAVKGYDWLKNIGMTNSQGLYTDGFHIAGYRENRSKTTCDERNEMVYTYNQGVVLSGLRGLWEATGKVSYLEDGHTLIQNVIRATGWHSRKGSSQSEHADDEETPGKWHGLGSDGILAEACDIAGTCNQDGQTFKGIFFHHFTAFCEPLPRHPVKPGKTHGATKGVASLHHHSCNGYAAWVMHNANAALKTRNKKGLFGAWWGAGLDKSSRTEIKDVDSLMPKGAIDYRTQCGLLEKLDILPEDDYDDEGVEILAGILGEMEEEAAQKRAEEWDEDPNTRGRGRTVETQGGGLSVVRAMWEAVRRRERV